MKKNEKSKWRSMNQRIIQIFFCLFCLSILSCQPAPQSQSIVTSDIDHFWEAYDKIIASKDSAEQYQYLQSLFLDKGSPGLKAFMEARGYTPASYIEVINSYPLFWSSIRENTYEAKSYAKALELEVAKIEKLYPDLKPAKVYFTIGALMSNGTTMDSLVLFGAELALADENTVTKEFPDTRGHLRPYFDGNPIKQITFLASHEFVHTQQKITVGNHLLPQCVIEGVAEFVAVKARKKPSPTPAISYGEANTDQVRHRFQKEMFSPYTNNWLYNSFENEFETRDMGYYIGYAICEKYYDKADDKAQAIKEMIELDYNDDKALGKFVDQSEWFFQPLNELRARYEADRPEIIGVGPFKNGSQNVNPALTEITILFSSPMDERFRGFEYGPLGEDHVLRVVDFKGFSEDRTSATIEVKLERGKHYQLILSPVFRDKEGVPLKSYIIDVKTEN